MRFRRPKDDLMFDKELNGNLSRRRFVKGAAALAFAQCAARMPMAARSQAKAGRVLAYVGTYTGAFGAGSNGEGIYRFEMDTVSGELLHRTLVAKTPSPSWIAIHPSRKYLYAVNEVADFHGSSGSVTAFAVNTERGDLSPLNSVSSEGTGPAHLSIDATGKFAFVANYAGGSIAVLPIRGDGSLDSAVDIHRDSSFIGSAHATNAPTESFAISGHDAPHAHMILPDPQKKFVLATDLGQDKIYTYRFDQATGKLLAPQTRAFVSLPSGDGPRHLAFHPSGEWVYSIQEEASTVAVFKYDSAAGSLTALQTISILPAGFAGTSFASEILVSPDGKFLYAANRLHDTIAAFSINPNGELKWLGETSTMGDYPGQCRIDPTGNFLYACNRRSDCITSFKIDRSTGLLAFTGRYTAAGSPGSITFL
jgi:6-phosphogluconolactonase